MNLVPIICRLPPCHGRVRVPLLRGVWNSPSCATCVCPGGQGQHSQRTHFSLIWGDAGRRGICHLLLACSVNQDISSSSTATVTILPGVINQGQNYSQPCPPTLPTPSQALHTCSSAGSCQVAARVQLHFSSLPLPCATTAAQRG